MQLNRLTWIEHESLGDIVTRGSVMQEYHYREAINRLPVPISPDYVADYERLLDKARGCFDVALYGERVTPQGESTIDKCFNAQFGGVMEQLETLTVTGSK